MAYEKLKIVPTGVTNIKKKKKDIVTTYTGSTNNLELNLAVSFCE